MAKDHVTIQPDDRSEAPTLALQPPIDVRSTSIAVLALLGVVGFLLLARAVFIPIAIALLASYALTPVINWLQLRAKLPKAIGAGLTLALLLIGLAIGLSSLQPEAIQILDIVPRATAKFSAAMRRNTREPSGAVEKIQKAASEIEKAANAAATTEPAPASSRTTTAKIPSDTSGLKVLEYVTAVTAGALAGAGQLAVVVALVYLLLVAGDTFRRTLVRVTGATLSKKKITVQILDQIHSQIQLYLLVQIAMSALLGVVTWIVFTVVGLDGALFWACLGAMLHLIPYAGPTAFVLIVALVAYAQFDNLQPVVVVVGSAVAIVTVIGLLLVPWLTQKVGRLNAITVFVSLLFWGWLWGIWGLLLGVPIVMAINAVCERVEGLQPISEFLGSAKKKATEEPS